MKRILRLFLPPILLLMISRLKQILNHKKSPFSKASNYQDDELVRVVVEKNLITRKSTRVNKVLDLASLRSIAGFGIGGFKPNLKVLDFGGGGGYHHDVFELVYHDRMHEWCVVETPLMVQGAKALETSCLHFRSEISAAREILGDVDVVFASGALQYTSDPLHYLQKLIDVNAQYLFITRTVLNEKDSRITFMQDSRLSANGPGPLPKGFNDKTISYPITVESKNEVEKLLKKKYEIRFTTYEDKAVHYFQGVPLNQYGYFCQRRAL
jgi:putative methyltransferase (TIGR04325 family)